jgi:purine-nucleoside phosphorylase
MEADEDPYAVARAAADDLRSRGFGDHDVLLVLGSGWADAAEAFGSPAQTVPIGHVPGFLVPVAEGHGQEIRSYDVAGVRVLVCTGRTHLYEGHGVEPVVHATRAAAALGCRVAVYTNANGAYRGDWKPGDCMVVRDHLNLTGRSPLQGARFVDLTDAYSPRLRAIAHRVHHGFVEGVYAMLPGPHYETRAEGVMLASFGADAIGMSTVLEVIAARELAMEVLALSMVTVTATPDGGYVAGDDTGDVGIDPSAVVAVAGQSATALGSTVRQIIEAAGGTS